jgi:hypothetical protein
MSNHLKNLTAVRVFTDYHHQYGYPLLAYGKLSRGLPPISNTLWHARTLQTSESRNVVRPNVDTLYSVLMYDLSQNDLNFTIPDVQDRLWLFSFYDL